MMEMFIVTFVVMMLAAGGLAVGYVFAGKEIKGSCGGINNIDGDSCNVCGRPAGDSCENPADTKA